MDTPPHPPTIVAQEIQIVDSEGRPRILLSAKSGAPLVSWLQANGDRQVEISLDPRGYPAVKLVNPTPDGPTAAFELDDKGAHVKLDRPGQSSAYLFLNNAGGSGVVLIDGQGTRRLDAIVAPDGSASIQRFGPDGKPIP